MKLGFKMYMHALGHMYSKLARALWATAPAWVALTIITNLAAYLIFGNSDTATQGDTSASNILAVPYFWTYLLVSQCLNFLTLGYIGPKLHRAVLPDKTSHLPFPFEAYLFGLMKVGLIGLGLAFLASRLISAISVTLPGPLVEFTVPVLLILIILYVMLRFAVILPCIAVGRPKTLSEAWVSTKPFRYALITSLLLLTISMGALHSIALIWPFDPWIRLVFGTIGSWFALMILLSYLNVMYRATRRHEFRMAQQT